MLLVLVVYLHSSLHVSGIVLPKNLWGVISSVWSFVVLSIRNISSSEHAGYLPLCDTNFATRDRSFLSIFKCLPHFFWRNRKRFLNGTNAILKFENLASRCNFFRFLFALQLFLINF